MIIGVDASRAFLRRRTGIEEYSYQVISHLRKTIPAGDRVILYIRRNQIVDFDLPENWMVKRLWAPRFWTQWRLSLEMLFHPPDVLFVPAHTVPIIHPARTVVTVHGLEYEMFPEAYSFWERLYMRLSIRFSVRAASLVVAVSENTKRDLVRVYGMPEEKLLVVYEGCSFRHSEQSEESRSVLESAANNGISRQARDDRKTPYLLFIGRLEERKNIVRIIEAFEILKEKYRIPHELVLVGNPGYGYEKIRFKIQNSKFKIREPGYVLEEKKVKLLKNADIFLFPTLYEGFGLPVLEAQAAGVPVLTSNSSSLPEVGGEGALYVDPLSAPDIAEKTWKILSEKEVRSAILAAGTENIRRFSWKKCSEEIAGLFRK